MKNNKTWLFWPLVLILFGGLVVLRGNIPERTQQTVSGITLSNASKVDEGTEDVQFFGVVIKATPKYTGFTTAIIEADDGANITVNLPPTCGARVPISGTRVNVIGQWAGPGMVTILNRKGITAVTDDMRHEDYPFIDDPKTAKPGQTAWSYGTIRKVRVNVDGSSEVIVTTNDFTLPAHMLTNVEYPGEGTGHAYLFTHSQDGTILVKAINE